LTNSPFLFCIEYNTWNKFIKAGEGIPGLNMFADTDIFGTWYLLALDYFACNKKL